MEWDVTTRTDSVHVGIVMLDGKQTHVLKVKHVFNHIRLYVK